VYKTTGALQGWGTVSMVFTIPSVFKTSHVKAQHEIKLLTKDRSLLYFRSCKKIILFSNPALPAFIIAAGTYHTCVLQSDDKSVACWGMNQAGQLGIGSTLNAGDSGGYHKFLKRVNLGTGVLHSLILYVLLGRCITFKCPMQPAVA
jgi:alpha-tubulin suppressor-like RCC1 family protein